MTPVHVAASAARRLAVVGLSPHRFWIETTSRLCMTQDAVVIRALRSNLCGPNPAQDTVAMRGFGLLRAARLSYGTEITLPRLIPPEDHRPEQAIATDGARCMIFGDPNDDIARLQIEALGRAQPGGTVLPYKDVSGIAGVLAFVPTGTQR